ncbi:hypothetical protein JKP88DRAFT_246492 [Tribonema minus]|uniref:Uncharacterized protein n=1 Tax=Tribonema minus TaxID=303371 RepID=A0A835Z144_9STRA|nr:hypothetical protein JKP88DRAFT_246492 [Tribonema minus]
MAAIALGSLTPTSARFDFTNMTGSNVAWNVTDNFTGASVYPTPSANYGWVRDVASGSISLTGLTPGNGYTIRVDLYVAAAGNWIPTWGLFWTSPFTATSPYVYVITDDRTLAMAGKARHDATTNSVLAVKQDGAGATSKLWGKSSTYLAPYAIAEGISYRVTMLAYPGRVSATRDLMVKLFSKTYSDTGALWSPPGVAAAPVLAAGSPTAVPGSTSCALSATLSTPSGWDSTRYLLGYRAAGAAATAAEAVVPATFAAWPGSLSASVASLARATTYSGTLYYTSDPSKAAASSSGWTPVGAAFSFSTSLASATVTVAYATSTALRASADTQYAGSYYARLRYAPAGGTPVYGDWVATTGGVIEFPARSGFAEKQSIAVSAELAASAGGADALTLADPTTASTNVVLRAYPKASLTATATFSRIAASVSTLAYAGTLYGRVNGGGWFLMPATGASVAVDAASGLAAGAARTYSLEVSYDGVNVSECDPKGAAATTVTAEVLGPGDAALTATACSSLVSATVALGTRVPAGLALKLRSNGADLATIVASGGAETKTMRLKFPGPRTSATLTLYPVSAAAAANDARRSSGLPLMSESSTACLSTRRRALSMAAYGIARSRGTCPRGTRRRRSRIRRPRRPRPPRPPRPPPLDPGVPEKAQRGVRPPPGQWRSLVASPSSPAMKPVYAVDPSGGVVVYESRKRARCALDPTPDSLRTALASGEAVGGGRVLSSSTPPSYARAPPPSPAPSSSDGRDGPARAAVVPAPPVPRMQRPSERRVRNPAPRRSVTLTLTATARCDCSPSGGLSLRVTASLSPSRKEEEGGGEEEGPKEEARA